MRRNRWFACASALMLFVAVLSPSAAVTHRIEAEAFYSDYSIQNCGYAITRWSCEQASGGYAVEGVDCDGEWIKLHLSLASPFAFRTALRSAGAIGYIRTFQIDYLTDPGETLIASLTMTTEPGGGVD